MPKNEEYTKSGFRIACEKYLTDEERKVLTYDQKLAMIAYGKQEERSDNRYNAIKTGISSEDMPDNSCNLETIGKLVDDIPDITDRQKEILRYRVLDWTDEEIADILNITRQTLFRDIWELQDKVDIEEILVDTGIVWHKKSMRQYDR